jgi:hypothetical protein
MKMLSKHTAWLVCALLAWACLVSGCSRREIYKKMVRSGIQVLKWPAEMEHLFGDSDHFITHWGFHDPGPRLWNSEVYFGGRFCLTMQVEVEVDYKTCAVIRTVAPPKFYLRKVNRLETRNGVLYDSYHRPVRAGRTRPASLFNGEAVCRRAARSISYLAAAAFFASAMMAWKAGLGDSWRRRAAIGQRRRSSALCSIPHEWRGRVPA